MNFLNRLNIRQKIFLVLAIMTAGIMLVGTIGIVQLNASSVRITGIYEKNLLPVKNLNLIRVHTRSLQTNIMQFFIETRLTKEELMSEIDRDSKEINRLLGDLEAHLPEDKYRMLNQNISNFNMNLKKIVDMISSGKIEDAAQYFYDYSVIIDNSNFSLSDLADYVSSQAEQTVNENSSAASKALIVVLATIVAAVGLGLSVGWVMGRLITVPIRKLADMADKVSEGDLKVEPLQVANQDEIGKLAGAVNQMVQNLRSIINQVGQTSQRLSVSSGEMMEASEQTSRASVTSASAVESIMVSAQNQLQSTIELTRALEEMTQGIQQVASSSEEVSTSSMAAFDYAKAGKDVIAQSVGTIEHLAADVMNTSSQIAQLGHKIKAINGMMELIASISKQTNLLSLNAAIEAARAGEHGRGFAVVANEVRKLAEESNSAALQVSEIVTDINKETSSLVASITKSAESAQSGLAAAHKAGDSFDEIAERVEYVSNQIISVSAIVEEMSASSEEILASVQTLGSMAENAAEQTEHISATTEQTLASMEEVKVSTVSLNELAEDLQKLIGQFRS